MKDIFILYKSDEIRKCRREEVLLSEQFKLNPALFVLLGPAGSATYDRDYIYNFYDIETNELIAWTTFSNLMCEDINSFDLEAKESIGYKDGQVPEVSMNGYKFINLGEVISQYGINDYKSIDQEYVNDFIDDNRFLSR